MGEFLCVRVEAAAPSERYAAGNSVAEYRREMGKHGMAATHANTLPPIGTAQPVLRVGVRMGVESDLRQIHSRNADKFDSLLIRLTAVDRLFRLDEHHLNFGHGPERIFRVAGNRCRQYHPGTQ